MTWAHTILSCTSSSSRVTTEVGVFTTLRVRLVTVLDCVMAALDVDARGSLESVGTFIRRVADRVMTAMVVCEGTCVSVGGECEQKG